MNSYLRRMMGSGKSIFATFALVALLGACSSKHGAEAIAEGTDSSELKSDDDMMIQDGEVLSNTDELSDNSSDKASDEVFVGAPSASKPSSVWHGSLKSSYTPDMKEWKVSRGESLSLIAEAVFGSARKWKKLHALNPEIVDANIIEPGQSLRLTASENVVAQVEEVKKDEAPAGPSAADLMAKDEQEAAAALKRANGESVTPAITEPVAPTAEAAPPESDNMAAAPNTALQATPEQSTPGAMGVVDNTAATDAAAPATAPTNAMSNMVKQVDLSGDKLKLRNVLLGVAAFFLLLSGFIFVLSRRKSKAS